MSFLSAYTLGGQGEEIACRFLKKYNFSIRDRNYWKKWGEIDIVAEKKNVLHFVEVKAVSCENLQLISIKNDYYRPEDNIHPKKLERLRRVVQTYLLEKRISDDGIWCFDIITVHIDRRRKKSKVTFIENLLL